MSMQLTSIETSLRFGLRPTMHCPQCGEMLPAANRAEFTGEGAVRNIWHCEDCSYVFDTGFVAQAD